MTHRAALAFAGVTGAAREMHPEVGAAFVLTHLENCTMTPTDFLSLIESVLQSRRVPFSRGAAIAFVESYWPLIQDNPDPWHWSACFVETGAVAAVEES